MSETNEKYYYDRPKLKPYWRKVVHFFLIVFGWLLFAYMWYFVIENFLPYDIHLVLLSFILICLILAPLSSFLWIFHCIALFKLFGKRRAPRENEEIIYSYDSMGNQVIANWNKVKIARLITISTVNKKKTFQITRKV